MAAQNNEGFLTDPAAIFAAPVVAEVADWEAGSVVGDTALTTLKEALADRYVIERELGRGGMATVYLARDHRHGRRVALKVMHPGMLASVSAERFLREIRLSASLTHPHILPLHDSGDANGVLFYVMPYIEGDSLRTRIARDGALAVAEALPLVREVVSALDYAHRHGIVHRDIKPENILLQDGHAVVADFGIARALAHALPTREGSELALDTITEAGVRPGTPAYMAPEQVAGNPGLDARADLYALGMLTYEALSGAHPFARRTPEGLLAAQLTELPVPLAEHRPEVPPALSDLVQRLLAKDPEERPPSADAVLAELEPIFTTPRDGVRRVVSQPTAAALGVIVVEGAQYSGSLISARLAMEFNREVYGVPGNVTQPPSFAPNQLIKQGAKLVMGWEDVVEELPTEIRAQLFPVETLAAEERASLFEQSLSELEKTLFSLLSADQARHVDELVELSGLNSSQVLATLFELEMKSVVRQMPGKNFVKALL